MLGTGDGAGLKLFTVEMTLNVPLLRRCSARFTSPASVVLEEGLLEMPILVLCTSQEGHVFANFETGYSPRPKFCQKTQNGGRDIRLFLGQTIG